MGVVCATGAGVGNPAGVSAKHNNRGPCIGRCPRVGYLSFRNQEGGAAHNHRLPPVPQNNADEPEMLPGDSNRWHLYFAKRPYGLLFATWICLKFLKRLIKVGDARHRAHRAKLRGLSLIPKTRSPLGKMVAGGGGFRCPVGYLSGCRFCGTRSRHRHRASEGTTRNAVRGCAGGAGEGGRGPWGLRRRRSWVGRRGRSGCPGRAGDP